MGNTSVAIKNNTIYSNQAGLAETENIVLSIFSENKYLIQGWYQNNISAAIPIKSSVIGIGANYDGMHTYSNKSLAVSYSGKVSNEIAFGMLLKRATNFIQDYGSIHYYNFEFGILAELAPEFNLGIHLFNPFGSISISDNIYQQKSIFRLGLAYQVDKILLLAADIDKQIQNQPNIKLGLEYHPANPIYIRIGINTYPFNFYSGLGLQWKSFQWDVAMSFHPVLGYSPSASLSYSFGKDE